MSTSPFPVTTQSEELELTERDYPAVINGHDVIARIDAPRLVLPFGDHPSHAVTYCITNQFAPSAIPGTEGYPPGSPYTVVCAGFNVWHCSFDDDGEWQAGHWGTHRDLAHALIAVVSAIEADEGAL